MVTHYDTLPINEDIALDLSMLEGIGAITHDESKSRSTFTLVNSPTWSAVATGVHGLSFTGVNSQYLECADTPNLDFTDSDYSLAVWVKWADTLTSEIVMGRYEVNVSGWELYLTNIGGTHYMTQRHHHAAGATTRTAGSSVGWTTGEWMLFSSSRVGGTVQHYRNGQPVTTTLSVGGLIDPENCTQDMVIGTRYTKNTNWYSGMMHRPRVWASALSAVEHMTIYELESGWFA